MRDLIRPLGMAALLVIAGPALAQDGNSPAQETAPAAETAPVTGTAQVDELPMGETEAEGGAYVRETFQDWRIVCVKAENERESCNMQQLLLDQNGNPVSQVSIAPLPPAAAPRAAAVEVATPLETLLSEDLRLSVDGGAAKRYRFSFCIPRACYSRFALSAEDVAALKAGNAATVTIVPLMAPDQTAGIKMSLSGFTAAYDAVAALMAQQ